MTVCLPNFIPSSVVLSISIFFSLTLSSLFHAAAELYDFDDDKVEVTSLTLH